MEIDEDGNAVATAPGTYQVTASLEEKTGGYWWAAESEEGARSQDDKIIEFTIAGESAPSEQTVRVFFDTDGVGEVPTQEIRKGDCAQEPAPLSKEGFNFMGWQQVKDSMVSPTVFDFSTPITEDTYLKALFVDPRDLGNDRFAVEIRDGAPKVDADDVVKIVVTTLTQAELDADYSLLLVSSPLADVPSPDKDVLEAQVKALGATPGIWFDISLYTLYSEMSNQTPGVAPASFAWFSSAVLSSEETSASERGDEARSRLCPSAISFLVRFAFATSLLLVTSATGALPNVLISKGSPLCSVSSMKKALRVMSLVIGVEKSKFSSDISHGDNTTRQPMKRNPFLDGLSGSCAQAPSLTACAGTLPAPLESKVTVCISAAGTRVLPAN